MITDLVIPIEFNEDAPISEIFTLWLPTLLDEFFIRTKKTIRQREYDVLRYRYGLDGQTTLTLEEVGIILEVTKQRVRQIADKALGELRELILTGKCLSRNVIMQQSLYQQLCDYRFTLTEDTIIKTEDEIIELTKAYFSIVNVDVPLLKLLLELYGFSPIILGASVTKSRVAWSHGDIDSKRLQDAIKAISDFLKEVAIAKSFTEVKLAINSNQVLRSRFSEDEIWQAIRLADDIEVVDDDSLQARFDRLRSIADKAYRILYNKGEPIHARELAIILNKESFAYGETSRLNIHHVGSRLSSDSRFEPIGRSGLWKLSAWEGITTAYVTQLMEDAFHSSGEPLQVQAVYEYVASRRPVERKAVDSYLRYDPRFTRIGRDLFALSDWGIPSASFTRKKRKQRSINKAKLCEYVEKVFASNHLREMYLSDLALEVSKLEPDAKPGSLYNRLLLSPAVEVVTKNEGSQRRNYAIFNPAYRMLLSKQDILTKDVGMGELIQTTVRRILKEKIGNRAVLMELRETIVAELRCPSASFYGAISKMNDLEKFIDENTKARTVRLKQSEHDFANQVERIKDPNLANEVRRVVRQLNVDAIDMALFQLGKIFEHTLKQYMIKAQGAGKYPVNTKDLSKLYFMIEWAGKVGVITDETALHYLRIERNDRSHGAVPDLDEREALLNNAPTIVKFYLDYIVLLSERASRII